MADWGYYVLPQEPVHRLGCAGLLVALREKPSRVHFDPENLHLRLKEEDAARWVTLTFESPLLEAGEICPGRATLSDRFEKHVDFFTFGGALTGCADPDEVIYTLESSAPMLELTSHQDDLPNQLTAEVEMMLGVFQADWGTDDDGFAHRLAELDPFEFYIASLQSILMRYNQAHALRETYHPLYEILQEEKEWLIESGQWPPQVPTLEKLFSRA
jgi:hypothetical protein